ncbi:unnamed protein product [Polarella glacialis]|uniref:Uncharacterized protein n=1 Tax=Polarella glacialis TaxID=89957 RepID=A0A813FZY8_POLGL|nr:unnamed protein product [Polarella glacialis]
MPTSMKRSLARVRPSRVSKAAVVKVAERTARSRSRSRPVKFRARREARVSRPVTAKALRPKSKAAKAAQDDEEESEEEETDDEDSDDDQMEKWEEKLLEMEEVKMSDLDPRAKLAPHLASTAKPVPYQLVIPCSDLGPTIDGFLFELANYRKALIGTEWADVRIEVSVIGNKVVSLDDDVERISWKIREGMTPHVLLGCGAFRNSAAKLWISYGRPGGFEKIIFQGYRFMKEKKAFLWGVSTSQNARHMRVHGISTKFGLVNGYLNGYISRPQCPELFRTIADATEDSEYATRHYAKDGIIVRFRMYAGITSPYMNRGGLQNKFEKKGEKITADQRSDVRKAEERWGASELNRLFPHLIGPPKPRRDKKTMEVNFYYSGCPPGESRRKRIAPRLLDSDRVKYKQENPKLQGCAAWKLYEGYKRARTMAEAAKFGSRPIDFAHDYNWGFLSVVGLSTATPWEVEVIDSSGAGVSSNKKGRLPAVASSEEKFVKVP